MNEQFTVETELHYNDLQSRIIISYNISNRKTSMANTFDITCTGSLSLSEDLGVTRQTGLEDKISFRFFQNVQTKIVLRLFLADFRMNCFADLRRCKSTFKLICGNLKMICVNQRMKQMEFYVLKTFFKVLIIIAIKNILKNISKRPGIFFKKPD